MDTKQSKSKNQSSQNQSNTMNDAQSSENQATQGQNPLAEAFAGFASTEEIAKDLSLLFVFAVGSSGFVELHADDRQDLAFRTLEYIKSFQMAI